MKASKKNSNRADKSLQSTDRSNFSVSSKKTPFAPWEKYQTSTSPIENWYTHFQNQATVGIIAGSVSQNIESIDIDVKNDCNNCFTNNGIMQ